MPKNQKLLAARAAQALTEAAPKITTLKIALGLDGFVDEILAVVDKRESATQFSRVPTILRLSEKIAEASGRSMNLELVVQRVKLGGNGPIMANALCSFGLPLTYLGCLGHPHLHPVFAELAQRAQVLSIANPGHTDALEFDDGKVMMGKHETLRDVTWENILKIIPRDVLAKLIGEASLVGFLNWTMLPAMSDIWKHLLSDICPHLPHSRRLMFFDLADPEKRTADDLREAMDLISKFSAHFHVILGLNEKESLEVAAALGLEPGHFDPETLQKRAADLRARLGLFQVVVHPTTYAVAADAQSTAYAEGPYTPKPLITTGAGDHFNSGFCLGNLLGLDPQLSLQLGVATSGFYVRTAKSPSVAELVEFLNKWPTA